MSELNMTPVNTTDRLENVIVRQTLDAFNFKPTPDQVNYIVTVIKEGKKVMKDILDEAFANVTPPTPSKAQSSASSEVPSTNEDMPSEKHDIKKQRTLLDAGAVPTKPAKASRPSRKASRSRTPARNTRRNNTDDLADEPPSAVPLPEDLPSPACDEIIAQETKPKDRSSRSGKKSPRAVLEGINTDLIQSAPDYRTAFSTYLEENAVSWAESKRIKAHEMLGLGIEKIMAAFNALMLKTDEYNLNHLKCPSSHVDSLFSALLYFALRQLGSGVPEVNKFFTEFLGEAPYRLGNVRARMAEKYPELDQYLNKLSKKVETSE